MTFPALFNTPERIIIYAYEDAGITQQGSTPNSEQMARGMSRLCDIINFWQTQGLKLWLQHDQSVTLVSGQGEYDIMPGGDVNITKPMRILQGYYLDSEDVRRPIWPLSANDWLTLSQVNQEGMVSQFWVQKLVDRLTVNFWYIPDDTAAEGTAHLFIQQQVENFSGLTDTMDFPQEWFIGLRWALAADIATGQPMQIVQRCEGKAEYYRMALEAWDVEDVPTQFAPDLRFTPGNIFNP